jgi:putative tricarboxylic transport membrane protein
MTARLSDDRGLTAHDLVTDLGGEPRHASADAPLPARVRWTRWIYLGLAWVFVGCIAAQVFFAGMAIFVDSLYWGWHTSFIHAFEFLPLLLLAFAFAARLPVAMRWLTFATVALIFAQYATANIGGMAGAFHPVSALIISWIAVTLASRSWQLARAANTQTRLAT